jgi:hypothetical protein
MLPILTISPLYPSAMAFYLSSACNTLYQTAGWYESSSICPRPLIQTTIAIIIITTGKAKEAAAEEVIGSN